MSRSCEELIDLFQKVGGRLVCKYDNKQCELNSIYSRRSIPEFRCDMTADISETLSEITENESFMHKYTTFFYTDNDDIIKTKNIEKIHENQRMNSIGFKIEFVRNKKGEMIFIDTNS